MCSRSLSVQGNGREAEDSHRAEDFVQKFEDLAEEHGVDPPATVRAGAEDDVEGHADQAGTNPRAGQVFNEPSSEPMKMTTCTVVVKWRYSCASPNSPSALRLAPAASAPDALRGSLAFREIQLPLCPMARMGLRLCRRPPGRLPRTPAPLCPAPGAEERAGAWWSPGEPRAAAGPPHVSTSPAPAPGRRGGERARLRPMPVLSWVSVSGLMKVARA